MTKQPLLTNLKIRHIVGVREILIALWKIIGIMIVFCIGKNGVTYGWQNTLDNYKLKYPTGKEMGRLELEVVKLERLTSDLYFLVGKWRLTREIGDKDGHFSLIWKKIDNEWVIISDHSR